MQLELFDYLPFNEGEEYYTCRKCNEELPISAFRVRADRSGYRVKSCRSCESRETQELLELHKKAPPKPSVCDCCSGPVEPDFMCLDHCHETLEVRGWLCNTCNTGIALLGDTLEGLEKGLAYMKGHYERS